jgi:hypothetical protein
MFMAKRFVVPDTHTSMVETKSTLKELPGELFKLWRWNATN